MARIELDLGLDVTSIFACKTATMNLIAVAKFFHIICKMVLLSLFVSECHDGGLLRLVSTYFGMVETNSRNMFYLYYLVWLKKASYLPTLRAKIQDIKDFRMRLLLFLEHIIKCFVNNNLPSDALHHACPDICEANITKNFMAQFKEDSKAVAKKI